MHPFMECQQSQAKIEESVQKHRLSWNLLPVPSNEEDAANRAIAVVESRVPRWGNNAWSKPRNHAIKLNKKVRRLGLKIALSARAAEGKLLIFDNLEVQTHKTKDMANNVKQVEDTKKDLLVDGGPINEKLKLATQNLHYVNVLPSIGLNVHSILLRDTLVMLHDAVNRIVERMHTPINR